MRSDFQKRQHFRKLNERFSFTPFRCRKLSLSVLLIQEIMKSFIERLGQAELTPVAGKLEFDGNFADHRRTPSRTGRRSCAQFADDDHSYYYPMCDTRQSTS